MRFAGLSFVPTARETPGEVQGFGRAFDRDAPIVS